MKLPTTGFFQKISSLFTNLVGSNARSGSNNSTSTSQQNSSSQLITQQQQQSDNPKKNTSIGVVVSAQMSRYLDRINKDFIEPQNNLEKYFAADVAVFMNPQLKAAVRNFAYSMAGTFQGVAIKNAPRKKRIQDIVDRFILRTKLKRYLGEFAYRGLLYGNGYQYNDIYRTGTTEAEIRSLIYIPVYGMIRLSDDIDKFHDPNEAFAQADTAFGVYRKQYPINIGIKDPVTVNSEKNQNKLIPGTGYGYDLVPEYMLGHWRFFNVPGERYGHSMIESTIYSCMSTRYVEMLGEAFWQRKFSRPLDVGSFQTDKDHSQITFSDEQVQLFLEQISKTRAVENGKQPARDITMIDGTMQRLPSDANTDKVTDLELYSENSLSETHSSPQMISMDRQANVGVLVQKHRDKIAAEEQTTVVMNDNLDQHVRLELALHGIDPDEIEYEYLWGQNFLIQDLLLINQQASNDFAKNRIPERVSCKVAGWLYREDPIAMQEDLQKEKQQRIDDSKNEVMNNSLVQQKMKNNELEDPLNDPLNQNNNGNNQNNNNSDENNDKENGNTNDLVN